MADKKSDSATASSTSLIEVSRSLRTVGATFSYSEKEYHYFIPPGDEPDVGDTILTSYHWGLVPGMPLDKPQNETKRAKARAVMPGSKHEPDVITINQYDDDDDMPSDEDTDEDRMFGGRRLQVGEAVRVRKAHAFINNMRPAVITSVHEATSRKAFRFYVQLIPMSALILRARAIKDITDAIEKVAAAKARMREIVSEHSETELFRKIAETNPEARELLNILEGVGVKKT